MAKPMKIQFDPKDFSPKFKLAASVATARDIKPILQNVKVKADKKLGLILQATDSEIGIRIRIDCDIVANGEAVLPKELMSKVLDRTKEERMTLESTESNVTINGERGEYHEFLTQPADEFPNVEEFEETAYHEIPAKALKEMIRRTTFATDTDNIKYALGGVYFEMVEDNISVVATDGRRLAWQEGKGNCVSGHKVETSILPVRTLQILERVLQDKSIDEDDDIRMAISANRVLFQCKDVTLFSRLVEGRFPKWRTIIPKSDDDTPVTIECITLLDAVSQAEISTTDLDPGIVFTFEKGKLTVEGKGKERGVSKGAEIPISFDGEKKTVKLDPKFMISFLRVLESGTVLSIYLPPDNDPIKITADDGGYVYVVMPMSA
jgi:DNA polymerase-3 subunit beta